MSREQAIKEKIALGLSREQAEEVVANQEAHDATHPHDAAPKKGAAKKPQPEAEVSLEELTVPELKELAAKKGVELHSDMVKADIIKAIEDHED